MLWQKICVSKYARGLGVRSLGDFNVFMLAKQGWRLLNNTNSLVSATMMARYIPKTDLLT